MYLSKSECLQAIELWSQTRPNYSEIKDLINPADAFHFTKKDCEWLNKHEEKNIQSSTKLHMYIGIHDSKLFIIVIPLDQNGKEKVLSSYLAKALAPLKNNVVLIEKQTVVITETSILSKNLEIIALNTDTEGSVLNEPNISEKASIIDIEQWKYLSLDWFYHECNDFNGERIFKSFSVPFADLVRSEEGYHHVICFFAFKKSEIYQRLIPVLIFVTVNEDTSEAKIIRNDDPDVKSGSNVYDWSQPCPPFCKEKKSLEFLK